MTSDPTDVSGELVRDLLRDQHPDLAEHPVRLGALGWDNQLWRLGDDLAVRLPWATESAEALLDNEYTWVPTLASSLPLPVPVPQRLGQPSARFPRRWIVTTWVRGTPADVAPVTDGREAAVVLGAFLTALHRPAPAEAPTGRRRGGRLVDHSQGVMELLADAAGRGLVPDPGAVRTVWDDAVAAPEWTGPAVWLHGDLHPANVLTDHGALCGVVDLGDLCSGDPAWDLAAAWTLLPDDEQERFHGSYRQAADAATRRRARGVAVARALVGLLVGDDGVRGRSGGKPTWGPPARAALDRLVADRVSDRSTT